MSALEKRLVAVIMAGGMGTRFWPLSTPARPKQFVTLFGERSLLQMSFDRLRGLVPPERILVLTNAAHVAIAREQLPELPEGHIIGEPVRRDTAAAVALAAVLVRERFGDSVILTLTADHLIEPTEIFQQDLVSAARQVAAADVFYTFGIRPAYPATVYGYLETGAAVAADDGIEHFELRQFKEKPDLETARRYVDSGRFLWNSGMFVWKAATILREIRTWLPGHSEALEPLGGCDGTPRWQEALEKAFAGIRPISIDYGVMEKTRTPLRCVASRFSWSDVGGWPALGDLLARDSRGNAVRGTLRAIDASGNLVFSEAPGETVALIGVEGLIVVRSGNRTLVARKEDADRIRELLES
ncbi:MAG TPA: sugar phosphate nucleotidyltransferase [Syntrophales bacterium]|nr:sugar phosphate nucleotidyltransferase [Syntrophales bacterium]